ncbi:hypothetical protein BP5796_11527 [Coleophoma crateriformis]|uniref:Rhodopsin domain-containing protein n=1 Tax=Coleophoma crateriformis TaxID=565419 RepID=A0A3D8QIL3_9HELO|nr:hypothetical protein BP5796_11527 [Coleophoma crateriformis]
MIDGLGIAIFAAEGTLLVLGIITVILRVYVRTRLTANLGWDDAFMVIAMLVNITDTGFTFHGIAIGDGKTFQQFIPVSTVALKVGSFRDQDNPDADLYSQSFLANCYSEAFHRNQKEESMTEQRFSIPTVMFAKLSIGTFLLRLIRDRTQKTILYMVLLVNVLFSLTYFFLVLFQCLPISAYWHITQQAGKCMPKEIFTAASYCHSVLIATTDLLFAILPIFMVWNLKMNLAMKFSVAGLLSTGAAAGITTLVRIPYIKTLGDDNPLTFISTAISLILLTCVESGLAIVVGNLAALRPLFIKFLGTRDEIKQVAASRRKISRKRVYPLHGKWQITDFGASMQKSFAGNTLRELCASESQEELNMKMVMDDRIADEEYETGKARSGKFYQGGVVYTRDTNFF